MKIPMNLFFAICILALSSAQSAPAQAQSIKINVASSGISPTQIPPYLAHEAGIYAKHGLEVSVVRTRADVAVMSLLAGDTAVIDVAGPVIIRGGLKGIDNVFIAAGAVSLNYWLMAAKTIATPQDLKGKIIGLASLTGSTMVATRYAVAKLGLNPDKDIKPIVIGGTPDRLTALRTGRIHATLLSPPTSFAAQREGFNLLADVAGMPSQDNAPATTQKFIREHPDIVRRFVRAHVEAVHLMKTNREMWLKVLGKYVKVDREILEKSYEASTTEAVFPRKQYPSLDAIKASLDQIGEDDPKAKSVKPEQFIDASFVRELDKSGYIDGLYKRN